MLLHLSLLLPHLLLALDSRWLLYLEHHFVRHTAVLTGPNFVCKNLGTLLDNDWLTGYSGCPRPFGRFQRLIDLFGFGLICLLDLSDHGTLWARQSRRLLLLLLI